MREFRRVFQDLLKNLQLTRVLVYACTNQINVRKAYLNQKQKKKLLKIERGSHQNNETISVFCAIVE